MHYLPTKNRRRISIRESMPISREIFFIDKDIQSPIKRDKIPIFQFYTTRKVLTNAKKLEGLKNDVSLFSRLYIANQLREGDMIICFSHENLLYPPSISDQGILISSKKSDIIKISNLLLYKTKK